MLGVNGVIHPSTWTKLPNLPNTYTAKRMVPVEDVNIEPLDQEWPPLKSAVEFCSPENVRGKYEVVGALLIANYMDAKIIISRFTMNCHIRVTPPNR
jgi:hypothetical protein